MHQKTTKSARPLTAQEVAKAQYLHQPKSRVAQFKSAPRAYKVNPDGSISTRFDLEYFK